MAVRNRKFRFPLRKPAEAQNQQALETFLAENVTPTEWRDLTLLNSWAVWTTTSGWSPSARCRREGNVVYLRGMIDSGTTTAGTVILVLPDEYRPEHSIMLPVVASGGLAAQIDVHPSGNVAIRSGFSATFTNIECSFPV